MTKKTIEKLYKSYMSTCKEFRDKVTFTQYVKGEYQKMALTMFEKESLQKENARLKRELATLKASQKLGGGLDEKELQKALNSCQRIFKTLNRGKRSLVLSKSAMVASVEYSESGRSKTYKDCSKTAIREAEKSAWEIMSLENDFRNIHHFLKHGTMKAEEKDNA